MMIYVASVMWLGGALAPRLYVKRGQNDFLLRISILAFYRGVVWFYLGGWGMALPSKGGGKVLSRGIHT